MNGEHLFRILSIQPRADPEDEVKTPDWGQLALMFKNVKNNDFRSTERFSREIVRIEKQKELDYARLATFLVHLGRVEMPEYAISLVPKISLECLSSLIVEWAKNRIFRPSFIERIFEMTQEEYLGDPTLAVRKPVKCPETSRVLCMSYRKSSSICSGRLNVSKYHWMIHSAIELYK